MTTHFNRTFFGWTAMIFAGVTACATVRAHADTIVAGTVEAQSDCASSPMEAWLSQGSTLLYQVEIPQHGSFEFHVLSGKYNLVVVSASGCLAEKELEARENDTTIVTLAPTQALKPVPSKPTTLLEQLIPSAWADWTDCPFCNQGWYPAPPVSFMPSLPPPWWYGFGAMTYGNFGYPAPWMRGGINGAAFPGTGGMFGDKPVLYVDGPDGTEVTIRANLPQSTHWLVNVPRFGAKQWNGIVQDHRFKSGDANYRYIYYDYRADETRFQDTRGFCAGRNDLIPRLGAALKSSGFMPSEIEDFRTYWTYKIPPSQRYCVYPQTRAQIGPVVDLSVTPAPSSFTQILFVVQLGENLDGKGKFHRAPVATWQPEAPKDDEREPASKARAGLRLREWGVGFLEGRTAK